MGDLTYGKNMRDYIDAGFIPLPWHVEEGSKRPSSKGYLLAEPPYEKWLKWFSDSEIGIVSRGWIGIDVDASEHGGKSGNETIAELEQALGKLPPTISSTARGDESESRIYFYSIPEDDRHYRDVGKDVEAIRPGHRFAAVSPSIHPNGKQYRWYTATGERMKGIPSRYEFPPLPQPWVEYLTAPAPRAGGYEGNIQDWLDALPGDEPNEFIRPRLEFLNTFDFGHTDLLKNLVWLVTLGAEGALGIRQAIEEVRSSWLRGAWTDRKYIDEFETALDWAVKRAAIVLTDPEKEITEEEIEEYFSRFEQAAQAAPPEVDRQSLAAALMVACERVADDWEAAQQDEEVAELLRRCLGLLSKVQTREQADKWFSVAKDAMRRMIGAHYGRD